MSTGPQHLAACRVDDCPECTHYLFFCMACDHCGHWGYQNADGWVLGSSWLVYCSEACCAENKDEPLDETREIR